MILLAWRLLTRVAVAIKNNIDYIAVFSELCNFLSTRATKFLSSYRKKSAFHGLSLAGGIQALKGKSPDKTGPLPRNTAAADSAILCGGNLKGLAGVIPGISCADGSSHAQSGSASIAL